MYIRLPHHTVPDTTETGTRPPRSIIMVAATSQQVGYGMQRSRAWCGTPPILGVVNMVGTRNFTCYMGAL